jgi:hypothetical protein
MVELLLHWQKVTKTLDQSKAMRADRHPLPHDWPFPTHFVSRGNQTQLGIKTMSFVKEKITQNRVTLLEN